MLYGVLDSNFKLCVFVVNGLIKGEIEKLSGQCLGLMCDESLTGRGLNSNSGYVRLFCLLPLVRLENRICLSRGVQVAGAAWHAATSIVAGVGDMVQRTGDGRTGQVLSDRTIERSGDAVCGLYRARRDEERGFLS
jgi:hypothetical protein